MEAQWHTPCATEGRRRPVPESDERGPFPYFDPTNPELAVKVVDGRKRIGKLCVFDSARSDVESTIIPSATASGVSASYHHGQDTLASAADI